MKGVAGVPSILGILSSNFLNGSGIGYVKQKLT